jgi:two-component system nitrate/nitrite response regulator NarL
VVEQLAEGHSLVDVVTRTAADVVLLDVRMPGGGLDAAETLRDHHPLVTVVVVSGETSTTLVRQLLAAGVRGYVAKSRLGGSLPDDVARCVAGDVVVTDPVVARVMEHHRLDG